MGILSPVLVHSSAYPRLIAFVTGPIDSFYSNPERADQKLKVCKQKSRKLVKFPLEMDKELLGYILDCDLARGQYGTFLGEVCQLGAFPVLYTIWHTAILRLKSVKLARLLPKTRLPWPMAPSREQSSYILGTFVFFY